MRNSDSWTPTKFVRDDKGDLRASRTDIEPGSWLIADRVAAFYEHAIAGHAVGDLLDLGCGYAPLYETYRACVRSVTLVDWGNSFHSNPHLDYVHDLNEPLDIFADRSFDTVILSDVLEHLTRPAQVLSEIARVLRPGGYLIMNVPFMYWVHEQPHDYYRYTRYGLEWLLAEADLQVSSLDPVGGMPEVLGDIVAKVVARLPVVGNGLSKVVFYTTCGFMATPVGRALSHRTREALPIGYAIVATRKST
jgi:SAM-dependent methyltransferase